MTGCGAFASLATNLSSASEALPRSLWLKWTTERTTPSFSRSSSEEEEKSHGISPTGNGNADAGAGTQRFRSMGHLRLKRPREIGSS